MTDNGITFTPWDPADHLKTDEEIILYLQGFIEDGDEALLAVAIADAKRAIARRPASSASGKRKIGFDALVESLKLIAENGLSLCPKSPVADH